MKKLFKMISILMCVVFLLSTPATVFATSTDSDDDDEMREELENKKNDLQDAQDEKDAMVGTLANIRDQKADLEVAKDNLSDYVVELDGQLMTLQDKLTQLELRIAEKEMEVSQIKEQLEAAEEDVENQYASMKQRIKFMYERGNETYIAMLLGAENFSEMLNKAEYIEELSNYDRDMLKQYQSTKETIVILKEQLESEEEALKTSQDEATEKEGEMSDLIDQKQEQIANYETDISNKEKAIKEYEAEIAAQNATIAALENQIAQAEAELRNRDVSGNEIPVEVPVYSGGAFCWPAPSYTRISDDYGNRIHPTLGVPQFHNGVDMAAPGGSPILAAADGTVIAASYSSSMGNYIMINHGGGLYTIYMHASALYVSPGQSVTRGQNIAAVGTTGRSTGNHLHFSVRRNGSYVNPWSFL